MKKNIARIVLCIICMFFCLSFFIISIPNMLYAKGNKKQSEKIIINFWHSDTFSGGIGSRKSFLSEVAKKYEKKNKNVIINVQGKTIDGINEEFGNGNYPDIISYGLGINIDVDKLIALPKANCVGGKIDNTCYASVWARNCYYLIYNKDEINEITVGIDNCNFPQLALYFSNYRDKKYKVATTERAYQDFIYGKINCYVGTLKDVYRLEKRGFDYFTEPLFGFCDLLQYVSVFKNEKVKYCIDFVNYLLDYDTTLMNNGIGLLKANGENGIRIEKIKEFPYKNSYKTLSVFCGLDSAKKLYETIEVNYYKEDFIKVINNVIFD